MAPATSAVDAVIRLYQRRLSPLKGFSCAHLVAYGGVSCSEAVRRTIVSRGVLHGAVPVVARFLACYHAATLLASTEVRGVCCCGGIPIPFRFGGRRRQS